MTVQTIDRAAVVAHADPIGAIGNIVQWARNLDTAAQAIALIVDTPFMPLSFWALPAGVAIRDFPTPWLKHPRESDEEYARRRQITIASGAQAVVYGDEIGFTPQASLQSIYVVRGKPGMYAEAMSALVKSHGHEIVVEELSDRICRVRGRRRGDQDWQRFEFTIDRAKRAGYDRQNPKYGSDPQAMLLPRCLSIACRAIAPDALKGLVAVEDITDEPDADAVPARTRTVKRAELQPEISAPAVARQVQSGARAASEGAPSGLLASAQRREAEASVALDQDDREGTQSGPPLPGEEAPEQGAMVPVDEKVWRAINARFVQLGVTGPGQNARRFDVISNMVGRTIQRGGELTADEGRLVIDSLAGNPGRRAVAEVLGADPIDEMDARAAEPEQPAAVAEAPSGPPLPDEADLPDPADGTDPWADAEDVR
jgi:hypothetical protein